MASATIDTPARPALAPSEVSEIWLGHLMSFLIPVASLAFVWTGPHRWYVAPLFIAPFAVFHWMDVRPRYERRQPVETLPSWPFDLIVYALAGIHFAILLGLVGLFSQQQIFSVDMVMIFVIVGGNSGFSIITAHELIHRKNAGEQLLGRLLLCTVLYEHFYTEHLRGHHARVGTPEDPATARYGERYNAFFRRTVPAQFRSAWRLEAKRLGDENMSLFDPRMLRNRVVHGLVIEWGIVAAVWWAFGGVACLAYVLQAFMAVRLLEAVNYFEHWGLRRTGRRVRPVDSWDTHSWFTYYGLIGLSRHADHHAYPSRPYQQLRVWDEAPVLPVGYVGLVDMVLTRNEDFVELASAELKARGLGPFADGAEPVADPEPSRGLGARLRAQWLHVPSLLRPAIVLAGVLGFTALGVSLESGGATTFVDAALRNGSMMAILAGVLLSRHLIERRVQNGWISWGAAFVLLFVVGTLTEPWLG